MPEGDTIHRAALRIGAALTGRVPTEIMSPHPRHRLARWPQRLGGRELRSVDAHGKHLFLRFEGALTMHSHLGMSGMWYVGREGERWSRSARRAWLVLCTEGYEVVQFDGPVLELMSDSRTRSDPRLAGLGGDVLGIEFDEQRYLDRLREDDPTRPIGDAILEQRTVAGIGNMWKAEACFATGVNPFRPLGEVADGEAIALVRFSREAMARSVREGNSARPHAVYRQAGRPCVRCGATIRQRGQWDNNRVTFWCPGCQH
jgi:endonuclease VIII